MKNRMIQTLILLVTIGTACIGLAESYGDDDDDDRRSGTDEVVNTKNIRSMANLSNPTYKQECSTCHMLYPAGLLPSRSWNTLMSNLKDHFGENASVDVKTAKTISEFLDKNSADKSSFRRSQKIASSINREDVPLRISETLYFKRKHHELSPKVWSRKSIGSRSNCVACHAGAEAGNFSEDQVRIPR